MQRCFQGRLRGRGQNTPAEQPAGSLLGDPAESGQRRGRPAPACWSASRSLERWLALDRRDGSAARGVGGLAVSEVAFGVLFGLDQVAAHRFSGAVWVAVGDLFQDFSVPGDRVGADLRDR
jgi:hypothetical protein